MKSVVIVADHSLVVHSIRMALRQVTGLQVTGVIDGRAGVREALALHAADIVVVDDMCGGPGDVRVARETVLARLRDARDDAPTAHRLLLTLEMGEDWMDAAFEAGVHTVLSKSLHPIGLGTLLREVVRGNVVQRFERRPAPMPECPLTEREREILTLVAGGATNRQIATSLWVTEQTVKFHLSNTYRKLGVSNRTEASHYAYVNNFVRAPETVAC